MYSTIIDNPPEILIMASNLTIDFSLHLYPIRKEFCGYMTAKGEIKETNCFTVFRQH